MIRPEREPAFWRDVAAHPGVAPAVTGVEPAAVASLCGRTDVIPLAAEHGGYIFITLDRASFACELHSLFKPEGWGREALIAGREALQVVWAVGFQLIVTHEVQTNPRSRPPISFGFKAAGKFREGLLGPMRLWTLTRADWEASPARRRQPCP